MRYLVYNVTHPVVPTNLSMWTITLYSSVITTLVYNDTKYSVPFMMLQPNSTVSNKENMGVGEEDKIRYVLCISS